MGAVPVDRSVEDVSMKTYEIAAIPADGIGPEVISAGIAVLEALAIRDGDFSISFT